ncbi:hypothetical protein HPP92_016215 [Vanilla planifolia]|uniref:RNA helicase n=1 Tax=Vanilla planifolia TaxID=51239 RepID=A0A835QF82_VANPL|nr:hypothetical protein HPP92_016215 [Vanilla planifolia]
MPKVKLYSMFTLKGDKDSIVYLKPSLYCLGKAEVTEEALHCSAEKSLPIASVEGRLVEEVRKNDTLIIVGETEAEKTTNYPSIYSMLDFVVTVRSLASPNQGSSCCYCHKRVAEECDVQLGQEVGFAIRFEDVTSSSTRIKYMTDGLLLRTQDREE